MLIGHSNTQTTQEASWNTKSLRVIAKHSGENGAYHNYNSTLVSSNTE